ncbi:DUF3780 domain-containing protein [Leptospira fletcheri]|uniref:DUF3780 domain-containing protein n=1 Tax=Leptospira fletcheri TaxID=2484981 RepID=A0A4R9G6I0_9LEPT|nr:DUF3780 domain-containing protein [Leptospira fletcheri]
MSRKRKTKNQNNETDKNESISFGVVPEESSHHFLVNLGYDISPYIYISEHFEIFDHPEKIKIEYLKKSEDPEMRVVLRREIWSEIQEVFEFEFNQRLKRAGLKTSKFSEGYNILPRLFGKELILLCWAIESADPGLIPVAIKNWQGLKPEERWWLYTMTSAATGQAVKHRNRGWRKAVRFALTENPINYEDD